MVQTQLRGDSSDFALIALGSNAKSVWGDAATTVQKAISGIAKVTGNTPVESRLYATPAFPEGTGPDFVNAVIRVRTDLTVQDLLAHLHKIEADAGRERVARWGQRTLDLDLIAFGDAVLPDAACHQYWRELSLKKQAKLAPDTLILPHPRLQDRSFVLVPMADVAPDWRHPLLGQTVLEMRDSRPRAEIESVRPI